MDYSRFLNPTAKRRYPGLHSLAPLNRIPGMINLAGGLPNPAAFPFNSFSFNTSDGATLTLSPENINNALQYSETQGLPGLIEWIWKFTEKFHKLSGAHEAYDVCVTSGSQDGLCKAFEAFLGEADTMLTESPTYASALSACRPTGCQLVGLDIDKHGIIPERMEELLAHWGERENKAMPFPKVLYTIPTGQNPSGASQTLDRKNRIYQIAQRFDLIIIEDDPYFLIEYDEYDESDTAEPPALQLRPPTSSYLSLDGDRRVVRLDSFSKIMSGGLRVGWVTAPKPLLQPIFLHQMVSSCQTSGLPQAVILTTLDHWGWDRFCLHVAFVQRLYKKRRDVAVALARRYLAQHASFDPPSAGMFLWVKLNNMEDTREFVEQHCRPGLVNVVHGAAFLPDPNQASPHIRVSFSVAKEADIEEGFRRMAHILEQYNEQA